MNKNPNSKIIVFEGVDKAGKTTQSHMFFEYLKTKHDPNKLVMYSFPDYNSATGKEIKAYLQGERDTFATEWLHLLFAANRHEWKRDLETALTNGKIIILNRYFESNIVYGYSHGLDEEWLYNLDRFMPKPDVTVILDVPITESNARNDNPDKNESDLQYMEIVRTNFLKFSDKYNWTVIDGSGSIEQVHKRIIDNIGIH